METYKSIYVNYLDNLKKINKEFNNGKSQGYCKDDALIEYYIMFGALNYMLRSRKINTDKFSQLSKEAWKDYEECVSKLKKTA